MQKILIAESSQIFTSTLVRALEGQFEVLTCADGRTALKLLPQFEPDILVLNLTLPYVDGLTLLQEAAFRPPLVLAITMHTNDYVYRAVSRLNISYTMVSPSAASVAARVRDLLQPQTGADLLRDKIIRHLHMLGLPTHLDGYSQLCLALPLFLENPQQTLTKELYPTVAKRCGCKDSRAVEHSIRKAIQSAWSNRDDNVWSKYFARSQKGFIPCPTNKEFICRLAEILRK